MIDAINKLLSLERKKTRKLDILAQPYHIPFIARNYILLGRSLMIG